MTSPGFAGGRPYVYGATRGTPSRARPQRVLDAGLAEETTVRRLEAELGAALHSASLLGEGRRVQQPCGTDAARRRHYRHGERGCQACGMPAAPAETPRPDQPPTLCEAS